MRSSVHFLCALSVLVISVSHVVAQVPGLGACPAPETIKDFDVRKYMGRWYEVERYFAYFQFGRKCVTADYSLRRDGTIDVVNSGISKWTKRRKLSRATAVARNQNEPAKLSVTVPGRFFSRTTNYWILDTDHHSYSVVWSCRKILGLFNAQYAWILSRRRTLPEETRLKIYKKLDDLGVKHSKFILSDQSNCPDDH